MAIVKFVNEPYFNEDALNKMFHYLTSQDNLLNNTSSLQAYVGGSNFSLLNADTIAWQFQYVKQHFHKTDGKQLIHFIISFSDKEMKSVNAASTFANYICSQYSSKFQILYAIHHKPNNFHIHFIVNTVSFVDGSRFYNLNGQPGFICNCINYYFRKEIAHFA